MCLECKNEIVINRGMRFRADSNTQAQCQAFRYSVSEAFRIPKQKTQTPKRYAELSANSPRTCIPRSFIFLKLTVEHIRNYLHADDFLTRIEFGA